MTINAHFDGKTIVPDEPVDLPINQPLRVIVEERLTFVDPPDGKPATVVEMIKAGVIGAWKDREDIQDSTTYAQDLRRRAENRGDAL